MHIHIFQEGNIIFKSDVTMQSWKYLVMCVLHSNENVFLHVILDRMW